MKDLVDVAGAIAAALQGFVGAMDAAELLGLVSDHGDAAVLGSIGNDAREASWYLSRAVRGLRELL